jgi:glutamine synthetase
MERRLTLLPETVGDPATHVRQGQPVERLPQSLDEALAALRQSEVIPAAMGPVLYDAFTAVQEAESQAFRGKDLETVAAAHRWRY